ncbi:MAG: SURF1 family protein [Candidatus Nanopelagicales bacterium]
MLREPRWIALLIAVPIGIVICLVLSDWQWNRYEGRKSSNAVQSANMALPMEDAAQAMPPGTEVTDANQWRMITATGTYVSAGQVLVRKKPLNNTNGFWVVTPLVTSAGDVVVVNRGWVRADSDAKSTPTVPPPPTGTVTVEGRIEASAANPGPRPADLPVGQVSSLDVATIGAVAGVSVLPGYLELTNSQPPQAPGLTTIPAPEISEGPHLSYSMQWIAFAVMFGIGVVLLARRELQVRRREAEIAQDDAPGDGAQDDPNADTRPGQSTELPQDSRY